jgi:hypothetical protein
MISIQTKLESTVQQYDKTRIDATKTFISSDQGAITNLEIKPDASASYFSVTSTKYLDWAYETAGTKNVTVRVTTSLGTPTTLSRTYDVVVLSSADDLLFSSDEDLIAQQDDIHRFLRDGRATFLDKHRESQKEILDELDRQRIFNNSGDKLSKTDLYSVAEIRDWSKYLTLYKIMTSNKNEVGDVYDDKAKNWLEFAKKAMATSIIRLNSEIPNVPSVPDLGSGRLVRR